MLFVSPIINILMWIGYLLGAFVMLWGLVPVWGGWQSLDYRGKAVTVGGTILCVLCGYNLVTTIVMPF